MATGKRFRVLLAAVIGTTGMLVVAATLTPRLLPPKQIPPAARDPAAPAAMEAADGGTARARLRLESEVLVAGRAVAWWRERLAALHARSDDEGRRLYALTRERAIANGLQVEEAGALVVQASSDLLMVPPKQEDE